MSAQRSVEKTADTVEEAIAQGLAELGVSPLEVMIEVLEEPVKGIMGMGARPAKVRLDVIRRDYGTATSVTSISTPIAESTPIVLPTPISSPVSVEKPARTRQEPRGERSERGDRRSRGGRGGSRRSRPAEDEQPDYLDIELEDAEDSSLSFLADMDEVPENELDEEAAIGKVVLTELLERMDLRARVVVRRARPGDQADNSPWILDIVGGQSVNRLIGRRGETLAALQYIARLITSRELQRRAEAIVDVGSYKAKRARGLHNMALRMADEAIQRGQTVALEPMPPHERRIIHIALRTRPDVSTKSIGEGAGRKVTIIPKADNGAADPQEETQGE
jgi:spoIIIJ-associated protein